MFSRSYSNLLDIESDTGTSKKLTRVNTATGSISTLDSDPNPNPSTVSDAPSQEKQKLIVASNQLPIKIHKRTDIGTSTGTSNYFFTWDEDSLLLQLKDGFDSNLEIIYVGFLTLKEEFSTKEQEELSQTLIEKFNCVPVFVPAETFAKFYLGFCKQHLWPLFHYMLPLSPELGFRFDKSTWQAYLSVNKFFADKIMEVLNPEEDFVWIHDYHLMVLPTFLRKRFNKLKLGFFLHSPFPSSEIYRTLPVREEILRALLNADLLGFHTFDYARHFLSSCGRILGLSHQSKRGYIGIEYYGRMVNIKILPVGIHMRQLKQAMDLKEMEIRVSELQKRFENRVVLLGVDDMDIFKGISLKLLAFERLLDQHENWRGKVVLVQIANPARGKGKDVEEVRNETYYVVEKINKKYGFDGYKPVELIENPLEFYERIAYYTIAEVCLVTAVRDGMNLIPYEYIISREGKFNKFNKLNELKKSMLVLSEFIGCSPSLSGAVKVNPWNIESVMEAMVFALNVSENEKGLRHEKNYRYVSTHDVAYWANSFLQDLIRVCKDHGKKRCWGLGFGLGFRVITLDPEFKRLNLEGIVKAYKRSKNRAIFLDYDGTLMPSGNCGDGRPSLEGVNVIKSLCGDLRNNVYVVSGRSKDQVGNWFSFCDRLVISAEHGYFIRKNKDSEWEPTIQVPNNFDWKQTAEPIMRIYAETTDGSVIDTKESSLSWDFSLADPDFGSCQAKELLDHLESVLMNEPVVVTMGHRCVEVKPQGVTKGLVAQQLISEFQHKPLRGDFVICVGDDMSDEDMFEVINSAGPALSPLAETFACTVGQKPGKAKYYLEDLSDVLRVLKGLADVSDSEWVGRKVESLSLE
ncbi:hypothetical protein LUZ60_014262 [Juncus effusus]|nr:hypothetical protein LUZ60_014262 [Juncus effusus]